MQSNHIETVKATLLSEINGPDTITAIRSNPVLAPLFNFNNAVYKFAKEVITDPIEQQRFYNEIQDIAINQIAGEGVHHER